MSDIALGVLLGLSIGFLGGAALFFRWKARYARLIRQDAVQRSQAVITGKVAEQLLPYLPGFGFNPKDVRFLGSPVDLVVFDGLAAGKLERIVFLEAKTGSAVLTARERQIRDVVNARQVEWSEWRADFPG